MEKSNIEHLKDIIGNFKSTHLLDTTEAEEFLDSIEDDIKEMDAEIISLKADVMELEDADDDKEEIELVNSDFVGLDTLNWSLEKGNLRVQQQVENFVLSLKNQYSVTIA